MFSRGRISTFLGGAFGRRDLCRILIFSSRGIFEIFNLLEKFTLFSIIGFGGFDFMRRRFGDREVCVDFTFFKGKGIWGQFPPRG